MVLDGDRVRLRPVEAADLAVLTAIRCYEKAGFRRVGTMREHWRSPEGSWQDGLLLDLLADELIRP